jgi:Zn-dependent protease
MIKPPFLQPDDRPSVISHVFGTPLVVMGWSGLPVIELVAWGIFSWIARQKQPDWSVSKQTCAGAFTATTLLGSEWCHNLAHTLVASRVGKPVDAIRIFWGTPLLIYYDINDKQVTPRQHILRALGGPVFNALLVPLAWIARQLTHRGSFTRYVADFTLGTNVFLCTVSLLPIPGIDGGPLLKWSMVECGRSPQQADEMVKTANLYLGAGLAAAGGLAVKKRKKWLAAVMAAFAATALAIGFGWLKEQK